MKDYSQHGESTYLYEFIKDKNITKYFVEVGALDGKTNSNARMFATVDRDWE